MNKIILFMLTTAVVCGGCSKEEGGALTALAGDDVRAIKVCSSLTDVIDVSASTRAPYAGTTITSFQARVVSSVTSGNFSTLYSNGTMTFTNTTAAFAYEGTLTSGYPWYPTATGDTDPSVYLHGFYPANTWTFASGTATFPVDGKTDVMITSAQGTSKFSDALVGTYPTLTFSHQLCQLRLKFMKSAATGFPAVTLKSVKLTKFRTLTTGILPTLSIALAATNPTPTSGGTSAAMNCYGWNGTTFDETAYTGKTVTITATTAAAAQSLVYVLAPPLITTADLNTAADYAFDVEYQIGSVTRTQTVGVQLTTNGTTAYTAPTMGKAFDITFNITGGTIKAKAAISADWSTGGSGSSDL
jgi:hypothetical protein